MAAPAHGHGTQHAAMSPKVAQTCPGSHCASALHPTCTQKPPSTHTRDGGRASTCSRHWPTGPQCPQGAPSSEQPGCGVGVEVALVVAGVDGRGWPVAAMGFQRTTSTAATIAPPGTAYPVPSLPTCRAVDNGVLYSTRPPGTWPMPGDGPGGETARSVPSIEVRKEAPAGAAQVVAVARVVPEEPLLHERARIQRDQRADRDQRVAERKSV